MTRFWHKRRFKLGGQRGFTLIELLIVVAIIGILAAIAIPLFASVQARARIAKGQADARSLVTAVTMYSAHMGFNPGALADLLATTANGLGQTAGPFMASLPALPSTSWNGAGTTYAYNTDTAGGFTVSANGDGATVAVP